MYKIITGMSKKYYDHIGKDSVQTWLEYWPKKFTLTIYSEDKLDINHKRINVISLDTMDQEYHNFQSRTVKKLNDRSKIFAKKAWPIMENLKTSDGYLIWIDADVITTDFITEEWLESLLPKNMFSCHLGVPQNEFYSVETGFFIINLENKFKEFFLEKYKNIYYTRDFSLMKKPFDGDVFGRVITEMRAIEGFTFNDLSPSLNGRSPFNKILKGKMIHFKAKKKINFNKEI
jgi:hypothetical protein